MKRRKHLEMKRKLCQFQLVSAITLSIGSVILCIILCYYFLDPKTTKLANGKTISDVLTLLIGKLGENINLAKAEILLAKPGVTIYSHVHPKGMKGYN